MQKNTKILIASLVGIVIAFSVAVFLIWKPSSEPVLNENVIREAERKAELNDYINKHDNDKIIEMLQDSNDVNDVISLVLAYAERGLKEQEKGGSQDVDVSKALENVEKAINDNPNNSELYRAKGYVYEVKPDYTASVEAYTKSIEIDPNNFRAYAGLGHVNRMRGNISVAFENLYKAAELNVDNDYVFIYSNLCALEYEGMKFEEAEKNCTIVINKESGVDMSAKLDALLLLAMMQIDKNTAKANEYLDRALVINPEQANLYVVRAEVNIKDNNLDDALVNSNKAIELSPSKAYAYLVLSKAYFAKSDFNNAIISATKGLDLVDKDVTLLSPGKLAVKSELYKIIANSYRDLGDGAKQSEFDLKSKDIFKNI